LGVEVVNGLDVGVTQLGERFGFLAEPAAGLGVGQRAFGQNLDGHVASEVLIPRPIDHTHAAFAQLLLDVIPPECLSNHEGNPAGHILGRWFVTSQRTPTIIAGCFTTGVSRW
jgi:hypothetical protein